MKRLWGKIFFVLVSANIIVVGLLYWGFTWSFELAFTRYLKEQEQERFQPLTVALAEEYVKRGGWSWVIDDHRVWQQLMRQYVIESPISPVLPLPGNALQLPSEVRSGPSNGEQSLRPPTANTDQPFRPPPNVRNRRTTTGFNPHVLLYDAAGTIIIGGANIDNDIYRFDIDRNGITIGQIGVFADSVLITSMLAVIENQNNDRIGYIIGGLLFITCLVASVLTTWLTVRIFRIKKGTSALVRGQYEHRIQIHGKDALSDLADDFNGLAEALGENRTAHQRWIASTSHELRTPVTILSGQIDALRDGIRKVTPDYLDGLSADVSRLNRLIDDLHQLSMSDLGALSYQKDEIDLSELVDDELSRAETSLPEGLSLTCQFNTESPALVLGDSPRIGQILKNLFQNSTRYTDSPGEIHVKLLQKGKWVFLTWQDSSPGVGNEALQKLTEPLYREETSRSRKVGGSGLGLAIANAIVVAHEGTMTASPSKLGGLCWEIKLPSLNAK